MLVKIKQPYSSSIRRQGNTSKKQAQNRNSFQNKGIVLQNILHCRNCYISKAVFKTELMYVILPQVFILP